MMAALYDRFGATAFSLAVRIVADPEAAEDVVAAAFGTLKDDPAVASQDGDQAATQLLVEVREQAIAHRQAERRRRGHALLRDPHSTDLPGPASGRLNQSVSEKPRDQLRAALHALPPQAREAIELTFFEGLAEAELSARLGVSATVVRDFICSGLAALRDATGSRS